MLSIKVTWRNILMEHTFTIGSIIDGVTNPKHKMLHFIQLKIFLKKEVGTSFLPG
jgi:hypothetical protein